MKLRLLIPIISAATVSGCAHTQKGYREQAPRIEATSAKKPDVILACLTAAWQKRGENPRYTPLANGGSISIELPTVLLTTGNLLALYDVETVDDRTRVKFYSMSTIAKLQHQMADQLHDCL